MRKFQHFLARRERVPVWVSLIGASGSGKTYSALRLGTGMVDSVGGKLWVIDTEARRALHYADSFRFHHVPFGEPFGSLDYLGAVRHCVEHGAQVVIIDSMSHEHEGQGGYLATQEAELERLSRGDQDRRERVQMLSWARPVALRNQCLQGLLQLSVNIIFCFRAKERLKPIKNQEGKMIPTEMGWSAIGGESLTYEMTASCLLHPRGMGVPVWETDYLGERAAMKLPKQFEGILRRGHVLDEETGKNLAAWAVGSGDVRTVAPNGAAEESQRIYPQGLPAGFREPYNLLAGASKHGSKILETAWGRLSKDEQRGLKEYKDEFKRQAAATDAAR